MNIHESLEHILNSESVLGDLFYDTFLTNYPQVQPYFEKVNLQRQAVILMMALMVVEQFETEHYPTTVLYLRELGAKHRERGIPAETYPFFRQALLDTLARHLEDHWTESLEAEWASAIDSAIHEMLVAYED